VRGAKPYRDLIFTGLLFQAGSWLTQLFATPSSHFNHSTYQQYKLTNQSTSQPSKIIQILIILQRIHHRQEDRILLKPTERLAEEAFAAYTAKIKQIPGCTYSKTFNGYYVPGTKESFEQIKQIFGENNITYTLKANHAAISVSKQTQQTSNTKPDEKKEAKPPSIAKSEKKEAAAAANTTNPLAIRLEHGEKSFRLYMPKNEADVQFVIGIRYSKWVKEEYYWRIPKYGDNLERIRKYFGDRLQEKIPNLLPPQPVEMPPPGVCRCVQMQNGRVSVLANYHAELISFLKKQPYPTYQPDKKLWTVAWHENIFKELSTCAQTHGLTLQWETATGKKIGTPRPLFKQMKSYRPVPEAYFLKLKELNYDEDTQRNYAMHFEEFINCHLGYAPEDITPEMIEKHMQYLVTERNLGVSSHRGAISAIKFYYERVLKQPKYTYLFEQPREEKKLPKILSKQEIKTVIAQANNLGHEFLLKLAYGTGLRLKEVIELKWTEINLDRKMILVLDAKNNKDRYVPLPKKVLELIPAYREKYGLIKYVIEPERNPGQQYSRRSAQSVMQYCLKKSGIEKPATFHTLRHCFATHALENGVSLRVIQQLLGHSSVKTTEIYTHVTQKTLDEFKSPLDELEP
jgi:site-specific recombinase XerD